MTYINEILTSAFKAPSLGIKPRERQLGLEDGSPVYKRMVLEPIVMPTVVQLHTKRPIMRHGSYPPPSYWPDKLATDVVFRCADPLNPLVESEGVRHVYIADGWPGPCTMEFEGTEFRRWFPRLTIERAERL